MLPFVHRFYRRFFRGCAAMMCGVGAGFLPASWGQSPPLGPPLTTVDKTDLSAGVLTGIVNFQVQQVVDKNNASLAAQGKDTRVSALPLQFWSPSMVATQYTNKPNQWIATLPVIIGIQVHVPHWFDRQIFIPLSLNVSCQSWQTGNGTLHVDPQFGPPSFEGGSWIEDAPGLSLIKDAVNSEVQKNFSLPAAMGQILNPCVSLGVAATTGPNDKFAAILFDLPPTAAGHHGVDTGITNALRPQITVNYLSLKRLVAHAPPSGEVLYHPTESITLDTFANFAERVSTTLTLKENDTVSLNIEPAVLSAPLLDQLVVIANINQQTPDNTQDSAFEVHSKDMSYAPGKHTLQITKTYTEPPNSVHDKPLFVKVPAYELTYEVAYRGEPVLTTH